LSVLTYYQALALRQLGQSDQATELLTRLLDQGRQQRDQPPSTGFLTSLPRFVFEAEDPTLRQRIVGTFLVGLAHLGLGDQSAARRAFLEVLALDPGHLAVLQEVRLLEALAASEPPTGLVEGGAQ
jgi:tetratricopeptide (TPR) repeat protein